MEPIVKIKSFNFVKLNNLEYGYFANNFLALMQETTAEKLHVDQRLIDAFADKKNTLDDISEQSTISNETVQINEIDKVTDDIVMSLFDTLEAGKKSPIATRKKAATELYNALKPYKTCYRLPQAQEVQSLRGLLVDVKKENLAAHVTTLGIDDIVEALEETTEQYGSLLEQRKINKEAANLGTAKSVREAMYELYEYITTVAFAFSVAIPSPELTNFVKTTNRLINNTNEDYNRRTAGNKKDEEGNKGDQEEEKDPIIVDPTEPTDPDEQPLSEITKFYPKENANPDRPLEFPRNKTAVLEGKGLKLVDSPEGKKAQLVLINYVDQRMPHEDSAILLNTDEKIEFTMMYDAAEGQYNFQIETYSNGTEEVVIIKYPETITLV